MQNGEGAPASGGISRQDRNYQYLSADIIPSVGHPLPAHHPSRLISPIISVDHSFFTAASPTAAANHSAGLIMGLQSLDQRRHVTVRFPEKNALMQLLFQWNMQYFTIL